MKKLLATLLAAAVLCSFAGISAGAASLEDEARTLVEGTIAITGGDAHTIETPTSTYTYAADRRWAQERYAAVAWIEQLFFGGRKTSIYLPGKTIHYFPDRGFYYEENADDDNVPFFFEEQVCHMPAYCDLDQLTAEMSTLDGKDCLVVRLPFSDDLDLPDIGFDTGPINFSLSLYYVDGDLKKISIDYSSGLSIPFTIVEITATADESVFQPGGIQLPAWLFRLPNQLVSWGSLFRVFILLFSSVVVPLLFPLPKPIRS